MTDLTSELNLVLATDNDDLADYLDATSASLRTSLQTIDGLFNGTTGHTHNGAHQGGSITAVADGSITSAKIADGAIQTADIADGAVTAPKLAPGSLLPEALFAGTTVVAGTNYTVAATILYVFCTAAITVTLPVAASTNRPITIVSGVGTVTVASAGGSVNGGSINTSTGAVMNGQVSQGDSITYKGDLTNWRAV